VSIGDGIGEIFKGLGVDYLIEGGQTMNPSTEDMLKAIDQVHAENIFILPNNKNIILAANQAKALTEDKNIIVIPTKTVPQGVSAVLSFDESAEPEELKDMMMEAVSMVKTGSVTFAARDSEIDGMTIHENDIMGMEEGKITHLGSDPSDVVMELLADMADEDSAMISVFYGSDVTEEQATELESEINEKYPKLDCMVHNGGQPLYYYIISIE
jgi:dihydroxyacetone kinase-like predicted kinase